MARDYQTKANVGALPDTITATRFGAGEFNSIAVELENAVSTSDQTLAPADGTGEVSNQLAMAMAIYGAGGGFYYADTGAVNAYVLNPISPKEAPPDYFDGFTIIFEPGTINTTASTVNVNSLGVKSITYSDGSALTGGELSGSCGIKYNLSNDRFELLFSSGSLSGVSVFYVVDATQADQGATSTNPDTMTLFDIANHISTATHATALFKHNPEAGTVTNYAFDTSLDLSSYPLLRLLFDNGAILTQVTGDEVLTVPSPENMVVTPRQKITGADMLSFDSAGIVYPEWWGAVSDGSIDCTNAIQWAIAAMYISGSPGVVRLLPTSNNYNITAQITQYGGVSVIGEDFTGVKIFNDTTTANLWSLGDTGLDINGDFCRLENISFVHNAAGASTAGLEVLGATDDGLTTASRFWLIKNIVIGGGGYQALRISGYSGEVDNIKISNWDRSLTLGEQCNDLRIERFNSSSDTEYAIVVISSMASPPLNVTFNNATIQLHNHATNPAVLLDGGRDIAFYNLYLERNYLGGSTTEVVIGDECQGISFYNTTRTDTDTDDICISSAAENTKIDGFWDNSSGLYTVEFAGAVIRQASIKDLYNTSAGLQALVHDQSTYGTIFEKRDNIIPNPSMFIVTGGTSWANPANGTIVFDNWEIEKADGAGTAPTVDVARTTTTPSYKIPYSAELDITNVGVADAGRRWKLNLPVPDPELFAGQDIFFSVMLNASTTITFTNAKILAIDSGANTAEAITTLDTTWQTLNVIHSVSISPTLLELQVILDAGGGTISTTGQVYACAFVGAVGRNPSCFHPNPGWMDDAYSTYA